MPVVFPYANRHEIADALFVAAWKIWFEIHRPQEAESWSVAAVPRLHRQAGLSAQLDGGRAPSLDVPCRMLVPWSYRNTMQAADLFMSSDAHILVRVETTYPRGRLVQGAQLSRTAIQCWEKLDDQHREELETEVTARFSADIQVGGSTAANTVLLSKDGPPDLQPPQAAAVAIHPGADSRP
jgi:hypothetical protein